MLVVVLKRITRTYRRIAERRTHNIIYIYIYCIDLIVPLGGATFVYKYISAAVAVGIPHTPTCKCQRFRGDLLWRPRNKHTTDIHIRIVYT